MTRPASAGLVVLLLVAGCSADASSPSGRATSQDLPVATAGDSSWSPPPLPSAMHGISNCGLAYLVQIAARTISLGDCAGLLPDHLIKPVVMERGTVFYVRITRETDGSLDYPIPAPDTRAVARAERRGPIVQYRAVRSGTVDLVAHGTTYCEGIDPHRGSCPVLRIRVR